MHGFNEIQRILQMLLDIDEIHISRLLDSPTVTHASLKLIAANSLIVASLSFIEIDDIPNSIEVVGLHVEILQVEGVLPNVDANDRNVGKKGILVGRGDDLQSLGGRVIAEPAPARALDTKGSHVEFLLENIQRTPILVDGVLERAILEYAAVSLLLGRGGRKVFPEERVVDVATTIKFQGRLKGDAFPGGLG